jgi:hypothetical protein
MSDKRNDQAESSPKGEKLAETAIFAPQEKCALNNAITETY